MAAKSSGRSSFVHGPPIPPYCAPAILIGQPFAKAYASIGVVRVSNEYASYEYDVCVCRSPKYAFLSVRKSGQISGELEALLSADAASGADSVPPDEQPDATLI